MRALFICWRPIQLINAINFVFNDTLSTKGHSDLIIINEFPNAQNIYNNIIKSNLFAKTTLLSYKPLNHFTYKYYLLFPKQHLFHLFGDNIDLNYNLLVASGWHIIFNSFAHLLKKSSIVFIEDGIGTYQGDTRKLDFTNIKYRILSFFKLAYYGINVDSLYLNNINMYKVDRWTEIKEAPSLRNNSTIKVINNIFCYKYKQINFKFILLDTPKTDFRPISNNLSRRNLIALIATIVDNKIIIRAHPFDYNCSIALYKDLFPITPPVIDDCDNIWELTCKNSINNNHVIISFFSSGAFYPKYLFNEEPYIIFLYKFQKISHKQYCTFEEQITILQSAYVDSNKIMTPSSLVELKQMLLKLV